MTLAEKFNFRVVEPFNPRFLWACNWIPIYAEEMQTISRDMTAEEFGFFMTCLGHLWTSGSLPEDTKDLARSLRRDKRVVRRLWPRVSGSLNEYLDFLAKAPGWKGEL